MANNYAEYEREVIVRVEETDERLKGEKAGKSYSPHIFSDEAKDAALEAVKKAPTLTG